MSDPAHDPIDRTYLEAEAVLSDEASRAARRTRVLAAVARDRESAAKPTSSRRWLAWGRGSWLVAASVTALGLFLASQLYRPFPLPAAPPHAPPARVAVPAPPPVSTRQAPATANTAAIATPPLTLKKVAPPALTGSLVPIPAPPAPAPPAPRLAAQAFPASESAAPPPPPPRAVDGVAGGQAQTLAVPPVAANQPQASDRAAADKETGSLASELVVTGAKREERIESVPIAVSVFAAKSRDVGGSPRRLADLGAKLRAAAVAGRTEDVEALLSDGAPVDAADSRGDTPLMKSVQADQPAVAGVLVSHGASLDRKNRDGVSARDMAAKTRDANLDEAIGLPP